MAFPTGQEISEYMYDDNYQALNGITPAVIFPTIVPSDDSADNFEIKPKAIQAIVAGDAVVVDAIGNTATYTLAANEVILVRPVRVNATGTTATLVALY